MVAGVAQAAATALIESAPAIIETVGPPVAEWLATTLGITAFVTARALQTDAAAQRAGSPSHQPSAQEPLTRFKIESLGPEPTPNYVASADNKKGKADKPVAPDPSETKPASQPSTSDECKAPSTSASQLLKEADFTQQEVDSAKARLQSSHRLRPLDVENDAEMDMFDTVNRVRDWLDGLRWRVGTLAPADPAAGRVRDLQALVARFDSIFSTPYTPIPQGATEAQILRAFRGDALRLSFGMECGLPELRGTPFDLPTNDPRVQAAIHDVLSPAARGARCPLKPEELQGSIEALENANSRFPKVLEAMRRHHMAETPAYRIAQERIGEVNTALQAYRAELALVVSPQSPGRPTN